MPVEDTQSTNFITDSLQYGQVSSSAPIKPPHDLADTEEHEVAEVRPEQEDSEMLHRSTGKDKILDYGGTAAYI
ncbi:hypothetical protein C8R44DRAFT_892587 [Mycena epipterygia]|nr:hypothetical protein C8R44DRAFT_892587 [Mycena epipterygia]